MLNLKSIDFNNIEKSYKYISKCLRESYIDKILKYLVLNNVDLDKLFYYLDKNNIFINYNDVVSELIKLKKIEIIEKYLNYFYRNNNQLISLKKELKNTNIDLKKIDMLINSNPALVIEEITHYPEYYLKEEKIYDFFNIVIKELLENEGKKYSDIEYLGSGAYSRVFAIGSKVLKIGNENKATFKIKNNKRFLKPLYRKNITYLNSNTTMFCLEITERLDMTNITYDDVYEIYKELREQGLVWLDTKIENVGRLIRDNKIYFDGIDYVDKESTSYTTDNYEVLPKGTVMLVDNDLIYDEKEFFKKNDYSLFEHCNVYEARYREEKRNEKKVGV